MNTTGKECVIKGKHFKTRKEAYKYFNLHQHTVSANMKKYNMSFEEACEYLLDKRAKLKKKHEIIKYKAANPVVYELDGKKFNNMKDVSRYLGIKYNRFMAYLYNHTFGSLEKAFNYFKNEYIPKFGRDFEPK